MYEITPQGNRQKAKNIVSALILGGFAVMLVTSVADSMPFKWAFQLGGLAVITAGIFVLTRYVSRTFSYKVEQTDTGADFTITELQRKSFVTVCRIALSNIKEIKVFDSTQKSAEKDFLATVRKDGRKTFNYCVDINPDKFVWVVADECGQSVAVKITYDEKLCEILGA